MYRIITWLSMLLLFFPACTVFSPATPDGWSTYSNSGYKFSIQHPDTLEVIQNEYGPYFMIGEQIQIGISEVNPLDCRGDCPVIENTETATLAGQQATKVYGYIGSIGGGIPQQYVSYVVNRDERYYKFTLYALGVNETSGDVSTIHALKAEDIKLFEKIMGTIEFIN